MSEPDPFKISEAVIDLWRCYTIERDIAKELEAENARLKAEVERIVAFGTHTIIPNKKLQAQVERLTKAGDDMAVWITIIGNSLTCWQIEEWLRAKKGLPSEKEQREKQIKAAKDGKDAQ